MRKMTEKERYSNCYCNDSDSMCSVCETYYDDHAEEHEENKRKRIQEEQEY